MLELDVRLLPAPKKHTTIHDMLEKLAPGEALRITNDHDPRPLKFELDHDHPNTYTFRYLESGPETWLVDILKSVDKPAEPTFQLLAKSNGISVSTATLETGAILPSHKIGNTVVIIVAEGKAFVETPSRKRQLSAGDVEIIPAHMPHALESLEHTVAFILHAETKH